MNLEKIVYIIMFLCLCLPGLVNFYPWISTSLNEHQYPEWKYHIWLFTSTVTGIIVSLSIYFATNSTVSYPTGTPAIIILCNTVIWLRMTFMYNQYPLPHFNDLPSYFKYEKQLKELKRLQKRKKRNNQ